MQGIDYGLGQSNIDKDTSIRFGVISAHEAPYWYEGSEPIYLYACPQCGVEALECPDACESCGYEFNDDFDMLEPFCFEYTGDGYRCFQSSDESDIFIEKSEYYTYAELCSPCAPGACYLLNPLTDPDPDNKCYCFGHDWFDDEKAPYPVYSVKTDEIVKP